MPRVKRYWIGDPYATTESVRTTKGRIVGERRKRLDDDVLLLGGKEAPVHEPRKTVAERLAGTRPLTIKRKSFPDAGETRAQPIGYGEAETRKVAAGPRSGISRGIASLFTAREKIVPVKRRISTTAEIQAKHESPEIK